MIRTLGAVAMVVLGISVVMADNSIQTLSAKTTHVSMFKNGYGLVTAEAALPNANGTYRIRPFPDATLGSFWLHWPEGIQVSSIRATQSKTGESIAAASVKELLEANIGNSAMVAYDDLWHKAQIIDMPFEHDEPILMPMEEASIPAPQPKQRGNLVILKEADDIHAVPISKIEMLRFDEKQVNYYLERPKMENVIEFTSKGETNEKPMITLTYLANGIAWNPSYVFEIEDEERGTISAKAVIVNDLVPLEQASTELIAGYPHISFAEQKSAFSLSPLRQLVEQLGRRTETYFGNNFAIMNQAMDSRAARGASVAAMPTEGISGEQTEDLYFYQVDDVTLKKGERGYFPMFAAKADYRHTYTWTITDFIDQNNNYRPDLAEQPQEIWHTLKITNSTPHPWTTAPAMVMRDGRIMGQDVLNYTTPGVESELKVTKVVSVSADFNEYEIKRERSATRYQQREYDQVTVKGELALTNYKEKPITVEITKELSGEITEAAGDPTIKKLAKGLSSVNPKSQIQWVVDIEPGDANAVKLHYAYTVLLRG